MLQISEFIQLVDELIESFSPRLVQSFFSSSTVELSNSRDPDNFLSQHDQALDQLYKDRLTELLGPIVYCSEESGIEHLPHSASATPRFLVLVDPLDTSELAVRTLVGYTHVMVFSLETGRPILAIVGDFFHRVRFFYAYEYCGRRYAFSRSLCGKTFQLSCSKSKSLCTSIITAFLMKPHDRFIPLCKQSSLINAVATRDDNTRRLGRLGNDFGAIGICHVAAGMTDAMVEFTKGFHIWDLWPGAFILDCAGGHIRTLEHDTLSFDIARASEKERVSIMDSRTKFIATGTVELGDQISKHLLEDA
jgi:myo-inositol-1(or 4)-monophosphatase